MSVWVWVMVRIRFIEKASEGIIDFIVDQLGWVSHVPELPGNDFNFFVHDHKVT